MTAAPPRGLLASDDVMRFDCGRAALNIWLQRHALANQASGASRVNGIVETETGRLIGYVALSAGQIERAFLPKPQQRHRPDPLPVLLLGQLAVDKDFQGRGFATSLLHFALKSALRASELIGCVGVITHPLDENLRRFYRQWGFDDLPFDPRRAMMVRIADVRRSFEERVSV